MIAGESLTATCPDCEAEFMVVYTPSAVESPKVARKTPDARFTCCPFCAAEIEEPDEYDEDADEE